MIGEAFAIGFPVKENAAAQLVVAARKDMTASFIFPSFSDFRRELKHFGLTSMKISSFNRQMSEDDDAARWISTFHHSPLMIHNASRSFLTFGSAEDRRSVHEIDG